MVYNGKEALEKLEREYYDIILTDVYMPVLDGYNLIRELRERKIYTPVAVMTSAELEKELFVKFLNEGVQKYIEKPFTPDHVQELENIIIIEKQKNKDNKTVRDIIKQQREAENSLKRAVHSYREITSIDLSNINEIDIEYIFKPLSWLGGDFFAVNRSGSMIKIFIADIAGHDAGTSFYTVMLKMLFDEHFAMKNEDFLNLVNYKLLLNTSFERMCTAQIIEIDISDNKRHINITNAGHPLPVMIDDAVRYIDISRCSLLGVFDKPLFKSYSTEILNKTRFIFYTDGLLETTILNEDNSRKKISQSEFLEFINKNKHKDLKMSIESIYQNILSLSKFKQMDDIMLIGIEA